MLRISIRLQYWIELWQSLGLKLSSLKQISHWFCRLGINSKWFTSHAYGFRQLLWRRTTQNLSGKSSKVIVTINLLFLANLKCERSERYYLTFCWTYLSSVSALSAISQATYIEVLTKKGREREERRERLVWKFPRSRTETKNWSVESML